MKPIAEVCFSCGRHYLSVAGVTVAMEGDKCRDGSMPEEVLPPIPEDELAQASIGGAPAKDLPIRVVRFFRGDLWDKRMLEWTANKINEEHYRDAETRDTTQQGNQPPV